MSGNVTSEIDETNSHIEQYSVRELFILDIILHVLFAVSSLGLIYIMLPAVQSQVSRRIIPAKRKRHHVVYLQIPCRIAASTVRADERASALVSGIYPVTYSRGYVA